MNANPDKQGDLINFAEVKKSTGMGKSFIYKSMNLGKFPLPVRIGSRAVRWIRSDIEQWKNNCREAGSSANVKPFSSTKEDGNAQRVK